MLKEKTHLFITTFGIDKSSIRSLAHILATSGVVNGEMSWPTVTVVILSLGLECAWPLAAQESAQETLIRAVSVDTLIISGLYALHTTTSDYFFFFFFLPFFLSFY